MFLLNTETILSGIMFFLGIYAVISMKQAAEQFSSAEYSRGDRPTSTPAQRLRSIRPLVVGVLAGIFVLPRLPASYVNSASLGFTMGVAFAILVLVLQKIRISAS